MFKLNFDAAVFSELSCSGVGAMIRNEKGEVMAAMSVRGPQVVESAVAKIIACRRALEFVGEAGFTDLVVEGDNLSVMKSLATSETDHSWLGHIIQDIKWLTRSFQNVSFSYMRRVANCAWTSEICKKYTRRHVLDGGKSFTCVRSTML